MRRACILLLTLAAVLAGCGGGDGPSLSEQARDRVDDVRKQADEIGREAEKLRTRAEKLRDRLADRVRETLDKINQAIPAAGPTTRAPVRGDASLEAFMTRVIEDVDGYWTKTLRAADLPEPQVSYVWVAPGRRYGTGCGNAADGDAAFYCPSDDTIYVGEDFADGILRGGGDFGVAYVIAHEYAHNVQQELGWFRAGRRLAVKPFELQADCMAGTWGNSVYRAGRVKPGDVEEAMRTAYAVGDFDRLNPQHHGTPEERRTAWLRGYRSGDPSVCQAYVPT